MPLAIEELGLSGYATIQTVEDCGPIARGDGSVVTGRFTTSRVNVIVRLTVAGPDGTVEVLEGTNVHPIWSVDRNDWIQLGELEEGERLQAANGIATVLSIAIVKTNVPVYNIEVHGEHVYQVGELGVLVHNTCDPDLLARWGAGSFGDVTNNVMFHFRKHGAEVRATDVNDYMRKAIQAMESRRGRGEMVEGVTEGVRRFRVHGVNRYVDVDTILEKVISFGAR
jgi:hypothetical protein